MASAARFGFESNFMYKYRDRRGLQLNHATVANANSAPTMHASMILLARWVRGTFIELYQLARYANARSEATLRPSVTRSLGILLKPSRRRKRPSASRPLSFQRGVMGREGGAVLSVLGRGAESRPIGRGGGG